MRCNPATRRWQKYWPREFGAALPLSGAGWRCTTSKPSYKQPIIHTITHLRNFFETSTQKTKSDRNMRFGAKALLYSYGKQ